MRCGTRLGSQGSGNSKGLAGKVRSVEADVMRKHRKLAIFVVVVFIVGAAALVIGNPGLDLLFALAVAPSAYLMWHFHHADKYKAESTKLLLGTFMLGAAFSMVALVIELFVSGPAPTSGLLSIFLYFMLGVGLVEEGVKFLAVRLYPYRSVHFDESMDGIIFGVAAALGFATVENVLYVFSNGVVDAFIRAFVSVPGHAFWGAITGYYLAEAKVQRRPLLAVVGLSVAVFFHGTFDTLATVVSDPILGIVMLGGLIWAIYFGIIKREIRKAQMESPYLPGRAT